MCFWSSRATHAAAVFGISNVEVFWCWALHRLSGFGPYIYPNGSIWKHFVESLITPYIIQKVSHSDYTGTKWPTVEAVQCFVNREIWVADPACSTEWKITSNQLRVNFYPFLSWWNSGTGRQPLLHKLCWFHFNFFCAEFKCSVWRKSVQYLSFTRFTKIELSWNFTRKNFY